MTSPALNSQLQPSLWIPGMESRLIILRLRPRSDLARPRPRPNLVFNKYFRTLLLHFLYTTKYKKNPIEQLINQNYFFY